MSIRSLLRRFNAVEREEHDQLRAIQERRKALAGLSDGELVVHNPDDIVEICAIASLIAERVLGLRMFDVQMMGALALQRGHIAEMQTGEGKTLAAVPAVVWYALQHRGVHVLTANDYLARRDAAWMRDIYGHFALSVGFISQDMGPEERRAAYQCDITYATANEIGFDYLRDGLARSADELVLRDFAFAVVDEADSILIDEARIPLVIAGGATGAAELPYRADALVAWMRPCRDYVTDEFARNVRLTDLGIRKTEAAFGCRNLFDEENLSLLTAVQDALHAHALLRRDVDYVVKQDSIDMVDEFKGRIAQDRRWPAGLQTALEAKEHVPFKMQGRVLGSITIQSLVGLYERICGMTGTAATQADEFLKVYKLHVAVIPPNRPVIRQDQPDVVFADKRSRDAALVDEIQRIHRTGRPILVGTASIQDSERLSRSLQCVGVAHWVLNARNDEAEAEIIAQAGALGAVTVSTNMAGRGTDILLGGNPPRNRDQVVALGGLYVIGTTRHEARRIDNQLRGRAGRQGDPGTSRFLISMEDDLLVRFGIEENHDVDSVQRTAESQNLEARETLWKYEGVVEHHRREVYAFRREILLSADWSIASLLPEEPYTRFVEKVGKGEVEKRGRELALACVDDLWADYLANVADLRGGVFWVSWGGNDPLFKFLSGVEAIYADFWRSLEQEVSTVFETGSVEDGRIRLPNAQRFERGATWTYLVTDQPFGSLGERAAKGAKRLMRKLRSRS